MRRLDQVILIGSFLPLCWLGMMAVHELGHAVIGWLTGGVVKSVVLHPLSISRTDVEPNPQPLLVVWAGPFVGVLLPLAAWSVFRWMKLPGEYLMRFFAGFCLIANGAYIGVGSFDGIGDAREMLRFKSPMWSLWLFGVLTVPLGFAMWNRLGPRFGLGAAKGEVDTKAAYVTLTVFLLTVLAEFAMSPHN